MKYQFFCYCYFDRDFFYRIKGNINTVIGKGFRRKRRKRKFPVMDSIFFSCLNDFIN